MNSPHAGKKGWLTGLVGVYLWGLCFLGAGTPYAWGVVSAEPAKPDEEAGLADLDKATQLKFSAKSLTDLESIADHCEAALKKGLGEENQKFAHQLLASSLLEAVGEITSRIFDAPTPDPRWPVLRGLALRYLERVVRHDDRQALAHYQIAQLCALPGGDAGKAKESLDQAIRLTSGEQQTEQPDGQNEKGQNELLSKALVLRAQLGQSNKERLRDLNQALQADPQNTKAREVRAIVQLAAGDYEKAIKDFTQVLKSDNGNVDALLGASQALARLDKLDDAIAHLDKVVELKPDSGRALVLRAQLHAAAKHHDKALADLDKALESEPEPSSYWVEAMLLRARIQMTQNRHQQAQADVERALERAPGHPRGLLLRSLLLASKGEFSRAITDMERLLRLDPDNHLWRMQLARYYQADKHPRRAIDIYNGILLLSEKNPEALRGRADALLSVGKHKEAIEDYNSVLTVEPEDSHVLNNLAWVLATSPRDDLRDGARAIELAQKACQLTKYEKAHILSTLAAAHAETGDFQAALKWSTKAVEIATGANKDQLSKEVESYQQQKPWRELQHVEEKE